MGRESTIRVWGRRIVTAATVGLLFAACSLFSPRGPLVEIEARGGLCVEGECRTVTTIDRVGTLMVVSAGQATTASLDAGLVRGLAAAVDGANYAAITAVPFTGTCPTAFDGVELVYTFHPAGRAAVTVASCTVKVDPANPLFRALDAALAQGR